MVRILPALVGAVALGAASIIRKKNRAKLATAKQVSVKRQRKAASGKTTKRRRKTAKR